MAGDCDYVRGLLIRHLRATALARMFGVSPKTAAKWLNGESIPDTKKLPRIAQTLGVSVAWLLGEEPPPSRLHTQQRLHELSAQIDALDRFLAVREGIQERGGPSCPEEALLLRLLAERCRLVGLDVDLDLGLAGGADPEARPGVPGGKP